MLQMFIFWEMVGLCSYALIAFWYKRPESINAGVKVFIMTHIGDISSACSHRHTVRWSSRQRTSHWIIWLPRVISGIQAGAAAGTLNTDLLVIVCLLGFRRCYSKISPSSHYLLGFIAQWKHQLQSAPCCMLPQWLRQVSIFLQDSSLSPRQQPSNRCTATAIGSQQSLG